jgi:hypothetical protein
LALLCLHLCRRSYTSEVLRETSAYGHPLRLLPARLHAQASQALLCMGASKEATLPTVCRYCFRGPGFTLRGRVATMLRGVVGGAPPCALPSVLPKAPAARRRASDASWHGRYRRRAALPIHFVLCGEPGGACLRAVVVMQGPMPGWAPPALCVNPQSGHCCDVRGLLGCALTSDAAPKP